MILFVTLMIQTFCIRLESLTNGKKVTRVDRCVKLMFADKPCDFKATDDTVTLIALESKMFVSQLTLG